MLRLLSALVLVFASVTSFANEASEPAPLAAKAMLLDVVRAGEKLVAVGDRGHVLISTDEGMSWAQSITPTRAMLTGVHFSDSQHGWAVGHEGVIIATRDGGRTWVRQDGGTDLETIYLDVLFLDARRGFAVGAYGRFQITDDGGETWNAGRPLEEEMHFNRIMRAPGGIIYLIGESGTFAVSEDDGATWAQMDLPYDGSLFAAVAPTESSVVLGGLRGHLLRSSDNGATWQTIRNEVKVLIMGAVRLDDGTLVFAGQGGHFFFSRDGGRTVNHWKPDGFGTSVADLVTTRDGAVLTVGEAGAVRVKLP
jgi:photosystem II stability/assembly factor-like uncharacterized protein